MSPREPKPRKFFDGGEVLRNRTQEGDARTAAAARCAQAALDQVAERVLSTHVERDVKVLPSEGLPEGEAAIVRYGGAGLPSEVSVALKEAFIGPGKLVGPANDVWWKHKAYKHVAFSSLFEDGRPGCRDALVLLGNHLLDTLPVDSAWLITDMFLVVSVDNVDPYHQNLYTGGFAYDRGGLRVLLNAGAVPGTPDVPRSMSWATRTPGGGAYAAAAFNTDAGTVAMNGWAAGAGGEGPWFHARWGTGVTVVVDVVPKVLADKTRGRAFEQNEQLYGFLATNCGERGRVRQPRAAASSAADKAAARANAAAATGQPLPSPHCSWCSTSGVDVVWRHKEGLLFCSTCYAAHSGGGNIKPSTTLAFRNARPPKQCPDGCDGCKAAGHAH